MTKDGNNALMIAAGVGYRDKNTRGTEAEALDALKVAIGAGLDLHQTESTGRDGAAGAADHAAPIPSSSFSSTQART